MLKWNKRQYKRRAHTTTQNQPRRPRTAILCKASTGIPDQMFNTIKTVPRKWQRKEELDSRLHNYRH